MQQSDKCIDLRGTPCPLNWVKTKLYLEDMATGAVLEVMVDDGAPAHNVPRSVEMDGHLILSLERNSEGVRICIRRQ